MTWVLDSSCGATHSHFYVRRFSSQGSRVPPCRPSPYLVLTGVQQPRDVSATLHAALHTRLQLLHLGRLNNYYKHWLHWNTVWDCGWQLLSHDLVLVKATVALLLMLFLVHRSTSSPPRPAVVEGDRGPRRAQPRAVELSLWVWNSINA